MFVTYLVISACLSGTPIECKEFKTRLDDNVTTTQCFMRAPIQIALWERDNPAWKFKRLTCKSLPTRLDGTLILKQDI